MTGKLFYSIIILLFSVLSLNVYSQETDIERNNESAFMLSDSAKVVLFSCDKGSELYSSFGHSALWVYDRSNGIDRLYNYGTFDFNTPNFYTKFVLGQLDYQLSVSTLKRFLLEYNYRGIGVYGQTLNLTLSEKQRMYEFLENNALPQNRTYRYDFVFDNCATRLRDVFAEVVDGEITYSLEDENISFREMLLQFLIPQSWIEFGIDMILGLPTDEIADTYQYMFLPKYLMTGVENATIAKDGTTRRLVAEGHQYLPMELHFNSPAFGSSTVLLILLLLVSVVSFVELRNHKHYRWVDFVLMYISAFAGAFLLFMWVGTDHKVVNANMNILWMLPAQFLFLMLMYGCFKKRVIQMSLIVLTYSALTLIAQFFWPQHSESAFQILNLIFLVRFLSYYIIRKKESING